MKIQNKINIREHDKVRHMSIIFSIFILSFSILATTAYAVSNTTGNYTAVLTIGQTPYQYGAFYLGGKAGWSWWDSIGPTGFGGPEKQKNLVALTVFDNTTGTIKPITGLATPPIWPQASNKKYTGSYSYKADTDPTLITTNNNYANNMDLWMVKSISLVGIINASLTFWEWYYTETNWDYGYVTVSTDGGNSWTNLPGTRTTNYNPYGTNLGNGITGISNVWVQETMNLTPYVGNKILLGFRFRSDAGVNYEGWYVDDIKITSGAATILNDDAETLTTIKTMSVNVTYPHLTLLNWTDPLTNTTKLQYDYRIQRVDLSEDISHPGTYMGYFKYDPFAEQYSGNYTVTLDTTINNTPLTASTQFQTTIFGCQNCHNRDKVGNETSFIHGRDSAMEACTYVCHSGTRGLYLISGYPAFGPPLVANPMHIHEMQYGHVGGFLPGSPHGYASQTAYDVRAHVTNTTCIQCHTSFVHNNAGTDTAKIANYTLYGMNISFTSGVHQNLTCEDCHGTLNYPDIPNDQYRISGILGNYKPRFTSYESFTDTYIIAVNSTGILRMVVTADNTAQSTALYVIGPVDNTTAKLQATGTNCNPYGYPCYKVQSLATPLYTNISNPFIGTWIVKLIQLQEGKIDYTISSNYPIERKPIIKIPECKECHNSGTTGDAYTKYEIPDWNPGFAHADTNNDDTLDVQCRACHDSTHKVSIKNCQDCHTKVLIGHSIVEPEFSQYTTDQCLKCHGDPHKVVVGGGSCIGCHGTNYTGADAIAINTLVNISSFNSSIHKNVNSTPIDTINDDDCWTCHFNKNMDRQDIKKCRDCHNKPWQWHGNTNITANLTELVMKR